MSIKNFDSIKVSTHTIIGTSNVEVPIETIFEKVPITHYTVIPKKRGRKPKLKIVTPEDKNKFVLPSKRGRKPKDKTIILDKNLNLESISNVILHLPIPLEKINDMDDELSFKYNA